MQGRVVNTWNTDPERIGEAWFMRRLPTGNWMSLNYYVSHADSDNGLSLNSSRGEFYTEIVEHDWDGNAVWRYQSPGEARLSHDMARLQNGNTLVIKDSQVEIPAICDKPFDDFHFVEVDPEGNTVWEWHVVDHFEEFGYSEAAKQLMRQRGGGMLLNNTLSVLPGNALEKKDARFAKGNILGSQRSTNTIYIVDKKSGEVVWNWGRGRGQLVGQHQPVMLHNGNILIYDNGGNGGYPTRTRFYTRLIEIDPVSGETVWEYAHEPHTFKETARFFSSSWGSVQRLPNGNTVSLDCHKGRLFEVTPSGEIVWEYISPFAWGRGTTVLDSGMFRTYRYGYDEVPEPDPVFKNTDGHMGVQPVKQVLPENLGLPSTDLP